MVALTAGRNTPQRDNQIYTYGVAAAATLYPGALVCLNAAGYLVPGSVSTTLKAVGRHEASTPVVGGAAAGDVSADIRPGTFKWANSAAGDAIAVADIGTDCYVVDDQTVAKTSGGGTRSIAGKVMAVDATGVWVRMGIR